MTQQRLYSGMQPSADSLQIGNYIGALLQWRELQDEYDAFFSVVDPPRPHPARRPGRAPREDASHGGAVHRRRDRAVAFDPDVQSHVPAHAELQWVLSTLTGFGEAGRMTQFKDKSARYGADATNVGLFTPTRC